MPIAMQDSSVWFDLEIPDRTLAETMINVTDSAVRELRALVGSALEKGLRIGIAKGGCSGLHYEMTLDEQRADDEVVERDGARFFIDRESARLLTGSTLDYHDSLTSAGFQIVNPNAARTCGCGSSFEPTSVT
jgi:iron-sulfur cluster assembly accessory protein